MKRDDQTDMGGMQESFLTTHWSLLEGVRHHPDKNQAIIGLLLERYWKPVYCYLRRKGHSNEEAKDLTQGFFHEVVLNRRLLERADPGKGRFRSFLLYALDQFQIDQRATRKWMNVHQPLGWVPSRSTNFWLGHSTRMPKAYRR